MMISAIQFSAISPEDLVKDRYIRHRHTSSTHKLLEGKAEIDEWVTDHPGEATKKYVKKGDVETYQPLVESYNRKGQVVRNGILTIGFKNGVYEDYDVVDGPGSRR